MPRGFIVDQASEHSSDLLDTSDDDCSSSDDAESSVASFLEIPAGKRSTGFGHQYYCAKCKVWVSEDSFSAAMKGSGVVHRACLRHAISADLGRSYRESFDDVKRFCIECRQNMPLTKFSGRSLKKGPSTNIKCRRCNDEDSSGDDVDLDDEDGPAPPVKRRRIIVSHDESE
jgi:hypothetical protein